MRIFVADEDPYAAKTLTDLLSELQPSAEVSVFTSVSSTLEAAIESFPGVIFSEVCFSDGDGVQLFSALQSINPKVNFVFLTESEDYYKQAFELFASGYEKKPVTRESLQKQLQNLRYPLSTEKPRFFAQTFGNFNFFADGNPVHFGRSKSKELLAYLVDRDGASLTRREIAKLLFGAVPYDRSLQAYVSMIVSALEKDLADVGASDVIIREKSGCRINKDVLRSDLFEYLSGSEDGLALYRGEYMQQYEWGVVFKTHYRKLSRKKK